MDNPDFRGAEILNQVHDSLVVQISYQHIPLVRHAEMLKLLFASLQLPLHFRGQTFTIPADCSVGLTLDKQEFLDKEKQIRNPRAQRGIKVNEHSTVAGLARELSGVCTEIGAACSI
jgi:hypothetical protein